MQTSAHPTAAHAAQVEFLAAEPDMFDPMADTPAPPPLLPTRIGFIGTLLSPAVVRFKPTRDQLHVVPVLCLELRSHGPGHQTMHAEQIYTDATRPQAEALAKRLPKGAQVHILTALADMRITLPHVDSVELSTTPVHHP